MRRILYAFVFAGCLMSGSGAFAQGYSGTYVGTYTASQLPGQILKIGLYFKQLTANTMIASYATSSGVGGMCQGTVKGNVATLTCTNAGDCKGTYRGRYTFTGLNVTWTYAGRDCLGPETGKGTANKIYGP